jgi:hypothetical protein
MMAVKSLLISGWSVRNLMMSYRIPATLPESREANLDDRFENLRLLREPVIYRARADGPGSTVGALQMELGCA